MNDPYHQIYTGEVFQKTRYIWHENTMMDFFRTQLLCLDYQPLNEGNKVWIRGKKKVVVCLADDIGTCNIDNNFYIPNMFDADTVVITDNFINSPTRYTVCRLPNSYFGVYSYVPNNQDWHPDRRFGFSVNRIDLKRLILLLELVKRHAYPGTTNALDLNSFYINFNCWDWGSSNSSNESFQESFQKFYNMLDLKYHKIYNQAFEQLITMMPLCNYSEDFDNVPTMSWLNAVVETYSSEYIVALSEKIFRALVTPVPWILYAGKYAVSFLEGLGFDVLSDICKSHNYDSLNELNTADWGDKSVEYWNTANIIVNELQNQEFDIIKQRCMTAAKHNQELLDSMKTRWPDDFAAWLPRVIEKIK